MVEVNTLRREFIADLMKQDTFRADVLTEVVKEGAKLAWSGSESDDSVSFEKWMTHASTADPLGALQRLWCDCRGALEDRIFGDDTEKRVSVMLAYAALAGVQQILLSE